MRGWTFIFLVLSNLIKLSFVWFFIEILRGSINSIAEYVQSKLISFKYAKYFFSQFASVRMEKVIIDTSPISYCGYQCSSPESDRRAISTITPDI